MNKEKDIDELIKMLDGFTTKGTRHINVQVNPEGHVATEEISIIEGMGCDLGDTACKIPNIILEDDDEF